MADTLTPTEALQQLRMLYEGIRDERHTYANTATRIGNAFLALLSYIAGAPFLRKDVDDTASGLITMLKGLAIGGAKKYGIDAEGVATLLKVIADSGVIGTLTSEDASIRNLTVTGAAHFFRLIIDEIKASGGSVLVTPANGFKVAKVVKDTDYRLYFRAEDGDRAVTNKWKVGMQAVSMSFNAATGEKLDDSNHYWWRLVTGVSAEAVTPDWDNEHKYHWITVSDTDAASGSAVPSENDEVAQLGYRIQGDDDPELRTYTDGDGTTHQYCPLQSAIYLSAYDSIDNGLVAPFLAFYRGVNDFDLGSHRKTYFDSVRNMLVGDVYNISGMIEDVVLSKPVIGYEITCKVNGVVAESLNLDTLRASDNKSIVFGFYKHGEAYVAPKAVVEGYDVNGVKIGTLGEVTNAASVSVDGGSIEDAVKTIVCTLADASGSKVKERGVGVVRNGEKGEDATFIRMELRSTPFADIYHEGDSYNATLTLVVFESKGGGEPKDVTSTIPTTRFRWTRTTSRGGDSDTGWNDTHANTGNALTLTEKDLDGDTYFLGELLSSDGTTTLKAVSVNI